MNSHTLARLVIALPAFPFLAAAVLGAWWVLFGAPSERATARVVTGALGLQVAAAFTAVGAFLATGRHTLDVRAGHWFQAGAYGFEVDFILDRLSAPMILVASVITFLVGVFSVRYLHREPGFFRFFILLAVFATGMSILVSGGSYDILFFGWELVGITSALLVGFFHERATPMRAALRVITTYRVCDIGIVVGTVFIHDATHSARFVDAFGNNPWPQGMLHGHGGTTLIVLCLLFAAMGKSALLPAGTWLPRAMEGPTPSSALFYCALSVHGGAFLLLRSQPFIEASRVGAAAVVAVGAGTAVLSAVTGRVQTDVKAALAWASMTHVGLIVVEIGLGFPRIALLHMLAHAMLRGWQMLRAPSVLREVITARAAHDGLPLPTGSLWGHALPTRAVEAVYRVAFDRFFLETAQQRWIAQPVMALGRFLDRNERRWVEALGGWHPTSTPGDSVRPSAANTRQPEGLAP